MQVCVGRALAIAGRLGGIGKTQPDGGHVDRGIVQDVFVDVRSVTELAQRVRGIGLTQCRGFADKAFCTFQAGKAAFRDLESAQTQLAHAGVVGGVRSAAATSESPLRRSGRAPARIFRQRRAAAQLSDAPARGARPQSCDRRMTAPSRAATRCEPRADEPCAKASPRPHPQHRSPGALPNGSTRPRPLRSKQRARAGRQRMSLSSIIRARSA